jgi:UDP-N-acetyl-D-mannosaminuronic acid transferase (WecB/TagA/CpsF family)
MIKGQIASGTGSKFVQRLRKGDSTTILGIPFFRGTAQEAVGRMMRGGLLVVPAAPALREMERDPLYSEALVEADLAIPDSAFMVALWNLLQHDLLKRVSGLEYLRCLLQARAVRLPGSCVWVMPSKESAERNRSWLAKQGIDLPQDYIYVAPIYGGVDETVEDPDLVEMLERLRPQHVMLTIGGGTQEKLGLYLKRQLSYQPAIHCIGAAIAFLSGDQVRIPAWADRLFLGWLFRCFYQPTRYVPRYWEARKLFSLMRRYRDRLPVTVSGPIS